MSDNIRSLLGQLGENQKAIAATAAQLTQRQCVAGEIAFHLGESYKPTVDDLHYLVNDDPAHRLPSAFGAHVDSLFYQQGNLLIRVMKEQRAEGLTPNKGDEIMNAATSGDYSKIRGLK
jgi:hypothetical protein